MVLILCNCPAYKPKLAPTLPPARHLCFREIISGVATPLTRAFDANSHTVYSAAHKPFRSEPHPEGTAGIAVELSKKNPGKVIGTMIAGNSGKPGGGLQDGSFQFRPENVDPFDGGQEERLVSNWLVAECGYGNEAEQKKLFFETLAGRWGMVKKEPDKDDRRTIQDVDYMSIDKQASYFADAWVFENAKLASIPHTKKTDPEGRKYTEIDLKLYEVPAEVCNTKFIFCAGPNAAGPKKDDKKKTGSMARTFCKDAKEDYEFL